MKNQNHFLQAFSFIIPFTESKSQSNLKTGDLGPIIFCVCLHWYTSWENIMCTWIFHKKCFLTRPIVYTRALCTFFLAMKILKSYTGSGCRVRPNLQSILVDWLWLLHASYHSFDLHHWQCICSILEMLLVSVAVWTVHHYPCNVICGYIYWIIETGKIVLYLLVLMSRLRGFVLSVWWHFQLVWCYLDMWLHHLNSLWLLNASSWIPSASQSLLLCNQYFVGSYWTCISSG